jgi:hypothetical protein
MVMTVSNSTKVNPGRWWCGQFFMGDDASFARISWIPQGSGDHNAFVPEGLSQNTRNKPGGPKSAGLKVSGGPAYQFLMSSPSGRVADPLPFGPLE